MAALNQNLQKLFDIAQKDEKLAIGLMSGTSLDGLDIALCSFSGHGLATKFKLLQFATLPYDEHFKSEVKQVFAQRHADLEKVCLLNEYIGTLHAEMVLQALTGWDIDPKNVDFIASHGQTIYHAPKIGREADGYGNGTLQIGDGDHLAVKTGILTICDFRQTHVAAGGEGAPLVLYGDVLLGSKAGEERVLLNIGGIANLTYLPADGDLNKVVCSDIGPGNTLIDAACREYFGKGFDKDGKMAYSGKVRYGLLTALLDNPFFKSALPKTTGPELFNMDYVNDALQRSDAAGIAKENIVCTLSAFTAASIAEFIKVNFKVERLKLFLSGGGAQNSFVVEHLKAALPGVVVGNTSDLGIDPDAKEAILFALLGNEALCGEAMRIGSNPAVLMGKFCFGG